MSQTPGEHHLNVYKGEDWSKPWRVYDLDADTGQSVQRSLTGYTASFLVYDVDGGTTVITFGSTTGASIPITSGTSDDYVTTTMTDTLTASLTDNTYNYKFSLTVGSTTLRFAQGTLTVHP